MQNRADSAEALRAIADSFAQLGEVAYAVDIRERLLRSTPGDYLLALDVLEAKARIPLDKMRAYFRLKKLHSELDRIMSAPDLPSAAWERASHVYEELGDVDSALRAIRKALEASAGGSGAQQRLAVLLARKGLTRSARHELALLLPKCRKDPSRLRVLGGLAARLEDWQLARQFAEAQFQCEPTDPECILYFARHLRMSGDRNRAQSLLASLFHAERRSPSISSEQWVQLAQELYDVGDINLTKEAVAEAMAREPTSEGARTLAAWTVQLEKLRKTVSVAPPRGNAPEHVRQGLVSRLVKIFRG
jgi:thioredoxin-like negative regulator of GroEL